MESIRKDNDEEKEVGPAAKKRKAGTDTGSIDAKCGYTGAQGAAAAATATTTTTTTTAPVSRIKDFDRTLPPRTSFAPRRYWALWAKGYHDDEEEGVEMNSSVTNTNGSGATADDEDNNVKGIRHEPHAKGGIDGNDNEGDVSRKSAGLLQDADADPRRLNNNRRRLLRKWEKEMELVLHCQRVQDRIKLCRRRILGESTARNRRREADELERERDEWTVLPTLFAEGGGWTTTSERSAFFNDHIRPRLVAGDKDLAWAILNCDKPLPIDVQKTLWMDPMCLLRNDRDIMMACIDKGLDGKIVRIVWSQDMANDKELVQKCFAMCPQCLGCSGGGNDGHGDDAGGLPPSNFEDMANLRAFAFPGHDNARRCRAAAPPPRAIAFSDHGNARRRRRAKPPPPRGLAIRAKFSPALFQDPALMADLVLVATTHYDASKNFAGWEEAAVKSNEEEEDAANITGEEDASNCSTDEDDDADCSTDEGDGAECITEEDEGAEYSTEEDDVAEYSTAVNQNSDDGMEEEGDSDDRIEAVDAAEDETAEDLTEQKEDAEASTEEKVAAEDLADAEEKVAAEDFAEVDEDADDRTEEEGVDDRTEEEGWVRSVVEGAFPRSGKDDDDAATVRRQPLLDSEDFALRVARGLLDAAIPESQRHACPVTYRGLSLRLRATPQVARAFVRLHPTNVLYVPPDLRGHDEIWGELWEAATTGIGGRGGNNNDNSSNNNNNISSEAHSTSADAHLRSKRIATKGLVLQLLEESNSKYWPERALNDLADVFPSLDPEIQQDRDVNLHMAVACALVPSTVLRNHLAPTLIQSRDFWIDLAEKHHCHHDLWTIVPAPEAVATDPAVVLAWARHAPAGLTGRTSGGRLRWIAHAVAKYPSLALLEDRAVLLNWMPLFFKRFKMLFHDRIPQTMLHDKSLWLELLPSLDDYSYAGRHIPHCLRHDPDIVDAQLRCPVTKWKTFRKCYSALPEKLKKRFAHRLVSAIESSDELHLLHKLSLFLSYESALLEIPEVAHAALSNGFNTESFDCEEVMQESDWSNDPDGMLSLARRVGTRSGGWYWFCCSEDLRTNKAFLLEVLKLDDPPCLEVEGDLKHDYDIMCAMFAHRHYRVPTTREMDFIRTVRARLQQYLSLEAFMAGIQSDESRRPHEGPAPVTLLRQDADTLKDFKRRMVELLGCVSHEEASVLRRVSLTFTMHGF